MSDNREKLLKIKADLSQAIITINDILGVGQHDSQQPNTEKQPFPAEPIASGLGDIVTAKQLGMIRAISREAGVDAEQECYELLNCSTCELSKRAASSFIDHLLKIQKHASQAPPLRRAT